MKKQNIKKSSNFPKALLWVVAVILTAACVWTTIEVSTAGVTINDLALEEENLHASQVDLNRQLVQSTSLGGISEKALAMGFVKPTKTIYVGNKVTEFSASLR